MVRQQPELELKRFKKPLKMGNYFCGIAVSDVAVHLRHFARAFCHAGDADIELCACAERSLLRAIYY